jgi:hypothetical protein
MRSLTVRWAAGCAAVGSVALGACALALGYVDRHRVPAGLTAWDFSNVFGGVANLAVPVVGFVLASRRPRNRVGWLLLVASLALGLGGFASAYGLHALVADPGSLPAGRAFAWLSNWIWVIPVAMLALLFLLFPTGRLRSRRWRPAAWFVGGAFTFTGVVLLVHATRIWSDPFGSASQAENPLLLAAVLILVVAALVVSVVAVVVRFARSRGEERLQLKWFAAAAVLVVATFIASMVTDSVVAAVLSNLAFLCLWVAVGSNQTRPLNAESAGHGGLTGSRVAGARGVVRLARPGPLRRPAARARSSPGSRGTGGTIRVGRPRAALT